MADIVVVDAVVEFSGRARRYGVFIMRRMSLGILFLHFYYLSHLFYYKLKNLIGFFA